MVENYFMQKLNRALAKVSRIGDSTTSGGDVRYCRKDFRFTHRGEKFYLTVCYEESLGAPFHEGIGFLMCDVKSSFTITRWGSKSRRSGLTCNSLKDIHPDGNDNDPKFISEKDALEKTIKFTTKDLDLATERRKFFYCNLIAKMEYGG